MLLRPPSAGWSLESDTREKAFHLMIATLMPLSARVSPVCSSHSTAAVLHTSTRNATCATPFPELLRRSASLDLATQALLLSGHYLMYRVNLFLLAWWILSTLKTIPNAELREEERRLDLFSTMWITYRSGFPRMEPYGYTDDSGWGCMLRSAQMLMTQALQRHTLGRCS